MRVVAQRSIKSSVIVNNEIVGSINSGLVLLVGFTHTDTEKDLDYMASKVVNLRIFDGLEKEESLLEKHLEILCISQFTLYANTSRGRRPSYIEAMPSGDANKLYQLFVTKLRSYGIHVETGIFGADMQVSITNDGPVTIVLESEGNV